MRRGSAEIKPGALVSPFDVLSTQDTECPSIAHIHPYDPKKDAEGIEIGVDESGAIWLIDGHRRAGAARISGKLLKVGRVVRVSSADMWLLAEGA